MKWLLGGSEHLTVCKGGGLSTYDPHDTRHRHGTQTQTDRTVIHIKIILLKSEYEEKSENNHHKDFPV